MSQECEATADAFFAHLQKSVQGWKAATVAQRGALLVQSRRYYRKPTMSMW
jgi:hypothetical protein